MQPLFLERFQRVIADRGNPGFALGDLGIHGVVLAEQVGEVVIGGFELRDGIGELGKFAVECVR